MSDTQIEFNDRVLQTIDNLLDAINVMKVTIDLLNKRIMALEDACKKQDEFKAGDKVRYNGYSTPSEKVFTVTNAEGSCIMVQDEYGRPYMWSKSQAVKIKED